MPATKPTVFLGIDPGASGGLAVIRGNVAVEFKTIPKTERETFDWVSSGVGRFSFAVIERITPAAFGFGKASMSKLYGSYMSLRMALVAAGIPFIAESSAVVWRALGIPPKKREETQTAWKNRLKAEARKRFPRLYPTLRTCDALLIALYCKEKYGATND